MLHSLLQNEKRYLLKRSTMDLTHEQIKIINAAGNIRIYAVAGSGKTTTLIEYAKARPE